MENFKKFVIDFKEELQKETCCMFEVRHMVTNRPYTGLVLDNGRGCCPALNMDVLYVAYQNGVDFDTLVETAISDITLINDYEQAKTRLTIQPANVRAYDPERLSEIVHTTIGDMVFTYHVLLNANEALETHQNLQTTEVTNDLLNTWGVDEATVKAAAVNSMMKMFPISDGQKIEDIIKAEVPSPIKPGVLTCKYGMNGAAVLLYDGIVDRLKGKYLIPSSIHEFLVIPMDAGFEPARLQEALRDVNETAVGPEDFLSNTLYYVTNGEVKAFAN